MYNKRTVSLIILLTFLSLVFGFSEGVSHAGNPVNANSTALRHFVDSGKLPPGIKKKIDESGQSEILLVLDDNDVRDLARQMRKARGLKFDDAGIRAEKARRYKEKKNTVFSRFSSANYAVLEDYHNFPIMNLEVNEEMLAGLLNTAEVSFIGENKAVIPHFAQSLPLINAPEAHLFGATGNGTAVAVLDTGINYTLAAFGSCTAPGVPAACKVGFEQCFATNGCQSNTNHGTNVSGIIAGVAPDTKILGLDIFRTNGFAYYNDILAALDWVMNNKATYNIVAVNMSFGGGSNTAPCPLDGLASAISTMKTAGVTVVISSGNDGYTNAIGAPACSPDAVSVGAVYDSNMGSVYWSGCTDLSTAADKVTCFSNSASFLTILAPGAIINAAGISMGGTSQAAPHVSGAVALMKGKDNALSVDQVISGLTSTGVPVTDTRNNITKPSIDLYGIVSVTTPVIGASPSSFSFTGAEGGLNPADKIMSITNDGAGTLNWSVVSSAGWLTPGPASGTGTGNVTLSINTTGLSQGIYNAVITITAVGALNSPKTVPVTLEIINTAYSEDFQTGNFTKFPWVTGGNGSWTIQNSTSHTGTFSAQSPAMTDGQSSHLQVTLDITSPGYVYFWVKTSTEPTWDQVKFYIDGVNSGLGNGWSGISDWTFVRSEHEVSTGVHTFKWIYSKDSSTSQGSDAVWLDDIFFPPSIPVPASATVRLSGATPSYYSGLQAAYDAAAGGETIQSLAMTFNENLNCNRAIPVTIKGGYDATFTTNTSNTTINGSLTVRYGIVTVQNIIIK